MKTNAQLRAALGSSVFWTFSCAPRQSCWVADCPVEPKQGVPIASGDVFAGRQLPPSINYGYRFLCVYGKQRGHLALSGRKATGAGAYGVDICLTLYNPSAAKVFSGCSNTFDGDSYAVMTDQR